MLARIRQTIINFYWWLRCKKSELDYIKNSSSFLRIEKESVDFVLGDVKLDSSSASPKQSIGKIRKLAKDKYTLLKDFVRPFKGWYQVKEDLLEQPKRGLIMVLVGLAKLLIAVSVLITNIFYLLITVLPCEWGQATNECSESLQDMMGLHHSRGLPARFFIATAAVIGAFCWTLMLAVLIPIGGLCRGIWNTLLGLTCIADGLAQIVSTPVKLLTRAVATAFNGGFLKIVDSGNMKNYLKHKADALAATGQVDPKAAKRVLIQLYKGQGFAQPREEAMVKGDLEKIETMSGCLGNFRMLEDASCDVLLTIAKSRRAAAPRP